MGDQRRVGITAHMVVKNEDRFIWYALSSILPYISKVLISDTGSTDQTVPIIESFHDGRIILRQENIQYPEELGKVRDRQVHDTDTDWFWIVDGDEVYSQSLCEEIVRIIRERGNELEGVVVGRYDLLGDIYHYQSESVGAYNIFGRHGHWALRLMRKSAIPGLHVSGTYPYEGYYDKDNVEVIHHDPEKFEFTKGRLWHAMYLKRSSNGSVLSDTFHRRKWKIELGNRFIGADTIPETFLLQHPEGIADVSAKRPLWYEVIASAVTPVKMLKRALRAGK